MNQECQKGSFFRPVPSLKKSSRPVPSRHKILSSRPVPSLPKIFRPVPSRPVPSQNYSSRPVPSFPKIFRPVPSRPFQKFYVPSRPVPNFFVPWKNCTKACLHVTAFNRRKGGKALKSPDLMLEFVKAAKQRTRPKFFRLVPSPPVLKFFTPSRSIPKFFIPSRHKIFCSCSPNP